ncbi:MAG: cytochrome C biogenesis protein [Xanthomonadaceae bacterium]|nr:cytochrome C biogenesis protein [Xanthomonadaceae bacterium]
MVMFLIAAVILLILTLHAVLRPLWAHSRKLAVGIATAMVVASGALYLHFGTPDALDPAMVRAPTTLAEARIQLERKLAKSPDDAEGWRLLGRAYTAEENAGEAARAFAKAAQLAPRDPEVLTEAAEARALAREDRRFDEAAITQLNQALAIDPLHQRARWFLGISQRQAGQPAKAAETWAPLLTRVDADTAATLLVQINEARATAGLAAMPSPTPAPASPSAAATGTKLPVEVAFARGIDTSHLPAEARVFVLARAVGGPPMPVAVQKHELGALPLSITLSDADSLMPTARLSGLGEVEVLARLSMSGTANKQEGDVESRPVRVSLPAKEPVRLVIGIE